MRSLDLKIGLFKSIIFRGKTLKDFGYRILQNVFSINWWLKIYWWLKKVELLWCVTCIVFEAIKCCGIRLNSLLKSPFGIENEKKNSSILKFISKWYWTKFYRIPVLFVEIAGLRSNDRLFIQMIMM